MSVYPDAIVIVTTRDAASWLKRARLMDSLTERRYMPFMVTLIPKLGTFSTWNRLRKRLFL
jgi:hypothetical protein